MMKKLHKKFFTFRRLVLMVLVLTSFCVYYFDLELPGEVGEFFEIGLSDSIKTVYDINEESSKNLAYVFCPQEDCLSFVQEKVSLAQESLSCAFFELEEENLIESLSSIQNRGVELNLVLDSEQISEENAQLLKDANLKYTTDEDRGTRYNNYMHHKFCVIDERYILTSSANPTENGFHYNDNNILFIPSEALALNYKEEFDQLKKGVFGFNKEDRLRFNNVSFSDSNSEYEIWSYMCPQNDCGNALIQELAKAEEEILVANFVLTLDGVENILVQKSQEGINVELLLESRMRNSQGSRTEELAETLDLRIDSNPKTMHHKFFIIDSQTVVTGSMNPSNSGTRYNDENVLVIHNVELASAYKKEFERMFLNASPFLELE
jgi:phosphatidylserine/phosphatidylglycerophosphate/cardiolipin synthase-like enzyme